MAKRVLLVISTIVLMPLLLSAAGHPVIPDLEQVQNEPAVQIEQKKDLDGFGITTPPPAAIHKTSFIEQKSYFYPFQSAMGPRLGLIMDSERLSNQEFPHAIVGFFYLLPSLGYRHIELGADLQSNAAGTINGAYRWIYYPTEGLRPFLKAGISLLIEPTKGIANIVDYQQYAFRFGGGVEDSLQDPVSLRWDLEANVSLKGAVLLNLVFGYSWGW